MSVTSGAAFDVAQFWHASFDELAIGTLLVPNVRCEQCWSDLSAARILEGLRPSSMLAHREAVFMCDDPQDCDNAGAYCEWLFEVRPDNRIERHDMHWATRIDMVLSDGESADGPLVRTYASNYWNGVASENPVWEYLTTSARIVSVEAY